jgi:hypothetical protein
LVLFPSGAQELDSQALLRQVAFEGIPSPEVLLSYKVQLSVNLTSISL